MTDNDAKRIVMARSLMWRNASDDEFFTYADGRLANGWEK